MPPLGQVLAIDEGTTGCTALMVAADGRVTGRGYREIAQFYPQPGWVEHDPVDILDRTLEAARDAVAQSGAAPAAIGITNQRETVVLWERATGKPVARAIVWQDRRTAARCIELAPRTAEIAQRTGLVLDPYFSATKLEWLLARDGLAARASRGELAFGTVDSWLIWQFTGGGVHATDFTNASRTMLFDIERRAWSPELGSVFGVPASLLPDVRASGADFGAANGALFGVTGTIPIRGVAGDQQAALFGQGCWRAGEGKNTYGTGAFLLMNAGARRPEGGAGLLTTLACDAAGEPVFALEASIFIAGAAVQWLRDGLGLVSNARETEALARSLASNDGVYFVPALTGLGAPHWEAAARGTIVGLTRGTTRAHFARAALEAMAFGTSEVLTVMRERSGAAFDVLRVDGGASANGWLMQFQADVLGVPVERAHVVESTALGAAGLAGVATGVWPDAAAFLATRRFDRFAPGEGAAAAQASVAGWGRAVRAALSWARDGAS